MAIDPREMMSPRERLVHNVNMRTHDGDTAPPSANFVREDTGFFGEDGFGFDDFLDIINPLQHLPPISLVYRELTGDEISAMAPPARADDAIPELTQDQVALLLSSVGLQPEAKGGDGAALGQNAADPTSSASLIEPAAAATPQPKKIADSDAGLKRNGLGPMKQTYVRPPVNNDFIRHAPIIEEMRTHMSARPGPAPLSDADQAWVVEAMAAALDKYRNGKALDQAREAKGTTIDAAH
jgi:hypothetical protein